MVPSFSWRPGITEPIFILSPLQGCNRTQKSCSYLDNNERTENNEDKWSSHKAESLPSPWLLILTSLNMYDYWHSWSLVSWCFHGYHNILSFGIHHECCCKLFCGSPQPCLTYFAVVVFDRPCQVGILNRICGGECPAQQLKEYLYQEVKFVLLGWKAPNQNIATFPLTHCRSADNCGILFFTDLPRLPGQLF